MRIDNFKNFVIHPETFSESKPKRFVAVACSALFNLITLYRFYKYFRARELKKNENAEVDKTDQVAKCIQELRRNDSRLDITEEKLRETLSAFNQEEEKRVREAFDKIFKTTKNLEEAVTIQYTIGASTVKKYQKMIIKNDSKDIEVLIRESTQQKGYYRYCHLIRTRKGYFEIESIFVLTKDQIAAIHLLGADVAAKTEKVKGWRLATQFQRHPIFKILGFPVYTTDPEEGEEQKYYFVNENGMIENISEADYYILLKEVLIT